MVLIKHHLLKVLKENFSHDISTSGMVVACLVKEIQICTELRKMAEMGLIQTEVVGNHKIFSILSIMDRKQDL